MRRLIAIVLMSVFSVVCVLSQEVVFGKNKVQYKKFDWQFIQSDHFDIYFAQSGYELASFTANAAEDAYHSIKSLLRYEINNRIPIIVYNSHNEFQQTNVIDEELSEGVGGVTELFKNRVVLPFEGNYKLFRHVIHHELVHAVINEMFYGGTIQSLLSSRTPLILPLWFNEGLAEFAALHWDTNSDMFIRDAAIHNYLPPIEQMSGYFAYRGGQSVFNYIASKYGEQKVGEVVNRIRGTRSIDNGFKSALGLTVKELSERWSKEQKKIYYPDIAKREDLDDIARKLTDHTKLKNFFNTSPAISPQGDKIVFITDRDDYFDIYLMSANDGSIIKRLISGQRTKDFEELHLLTPGITWSPDGKKVAVAVKSDGQDAIMIVDVETGDIERLTFELDGIFSVDWSRDGKKLAFVGLKAPQTDIYTYSFSDRKLTNLTNDIFSDSDPTFSPNGKMVYFSSDRGVYVNAGTIPQNFKMSLYDYSKKSLYAVSLDSNDIRRVTQSSFGEDTQPIVSSDGNKLLFISDRNGINNIYEMNLITGSIRPVTNSLSGIYQLSLSYDGTKLVFASLSKAGFDIYMLRAPFERTIKTAEIDPTEFVKRNILERQVAEQKSQPSVETKPEKDTVQATERYVVVPDTLQDRNVYYGVPSADYSNYDFSERAMRDTIRSRDEHVFTIANNIDEAGNFIPRKYKLSFSPDLVYGAAGYSTFYGIQGSTIMAFSDMLGDHRIIFQTNLLIDLKNSDYGITYLYMPYRIDFGFQAFHSAQFLWLEDSYGYGYWHRFRSWAIGLQALYPIDHYNRIEFGSFWLNLSRENLDDPTAPAQLRSFILPTLTYTHDNSLWLSGWFAPTNGSRFNVSAWGSTKYSSESLEFLTVTADYRDYNKITRDLIFVYRLTGGLSNGKNRQSFFIGGTEGWINRRFSNDYIPIEDVEDYAFLTPVLPLRGYDYNVQNGTRFGLVNIEFRFPLVKYLIFGALPVGFRDILGAAFVDAGSAWTNEKIWRAFRPDDNGHTVTNDLLFGTGFGVRLFFLGLPFRIDIAWQWDVQGFSLPTYYFSLGPEF